MNFWVTGSSTWVCNTVDMSRSSSHAPGCGPDNTSLAPDLVANTVF